MGAIAVFTTVVAGCSGQTELTEQNQTVPKPPSQKPPVEYIQADRVVPEKQAAGIAVTVAPAATGTKDPREPGPTDDGNFGDVVSDLIRNQTAKESTLDIPGFDEKQAEFERGKVTWEEPKPPSADNTQTIDIALPWKQVPGFQVWVDHKNKRVMTRGSICLRQGGLEMFACPFGTKEHESIVSVHAKASSIHASLLAVGISPGKPVQWQPEYRPVTGPKIGIQVIWKEGDKEKSAKAQTMIRESRSGAEMTEDWVFGGSEIFIANEGYPNSYYADSGEMICLSNFSTAMMDVPIPSSKADSGLLFEANTENIPQLETKVYLVFSKIE